MTKIGNGNGLICGLHSKPHTVRAQNTLRSSGILPIHSRKLTQMTKIGNGNGLICGLLKFRKWFKNGLKAQKLLLPFQGVWSLHAKVEWFTFKISYCSSPKYIEMIVAFCDNLHYQLKAEFFFPILFYSYFKISFHQRTLYDTFSCLIPKHFLPLHKKYNIIHYLI